MLIGVQITGMNTYFNSNGLGHFIKLEFRSDTFSFQLILNLRGNSASKAFTKLHGGLLSILENLFKVELVS